MSVGDAWTLVIFFSVVFAAIGFIVGHITGMKDEKVRERTGRDPDYHLDYY